MARTDSTSFKVAFFSFSAALSRSSVSFKSPIASRRLILIRSTDSTTAFIAVGFSALWALVVEGFVRVRSGAGSVGAANGSASNGASNGAAGGWDAGSYYGRGTQEERARAYSLRAIYFNRDRYRTEADCLTAAYTQQLPLELCR